MTSRCTSSTSSRTPCARRDRRRQTIVADRAADELSIAVEDDRPGLPVEPEQALDPFFTTKTNNKTGLGLSLFRQAAEAAGGGLSVGRSQDLGVVAGAPGCGSATWTARLWATSPRPSPPCSPPTRRTSSGNDSEQTAPGGRTSLRGPENTGSAFRRRNDLVPGGVALNHGHHLRTVNPSGLKRRRGEWLKQ